MNNKNRVLEFYEGEKSQSERVITHTSRDREAADTHMYQSASWEKVNHSGLLIKSPEGRIHAVLDERHLSVSYKHRVQAEIDRIIAHYAPDEIKGEAIKDTWLNRCKYE